MELQRRDLLKGMGGASVAALVPRPSSAQRERRAAPPPIRVGQIGVGHAHATKLSVYQASRDYEVVGVVESDPQLRRKAEKHPEYRDVAWMTEEQLLNTPGLQVVLVETHVRDLLDKAETCIAAGKHVHLDKPAGESLPHFRRILHAAQQQTLLVQMGYMYRYNPAVMLLREFLANGWLGDVFEVHTVMSKVVDPASRRRLAEYPGGMMFELGCHIIDLTVGVLGRPTEIVSFAQHAASIDDRLADNMLAVFRYPRATATVKSSAMEVEGFARRHFVVCGTDGTFHIQPLDNPSARVALNTSRDTYRKGYQDVTFPRYTRYIADAADMARILRDEKTNDFSYEHDLTVQTAVLQASGLQARA